MKEKLIKLLLSAEKVANETGFFNCHKSRPKAELIADYLIQNGVVVLPCKVDDIVYKVCDIESVHRRILEMKVLTIELSSDKGVVYLKTTKKYRYNYGKETFDDFGKTVFLSREEAENKLKEYKGE